MGYRYQALQESLAGYLKTGMPLVAYDGKDLKSAGFGDDIGLYYFIPKIAYSLHISVDQAVNLFFVLLTLASLALGMIGFYLLFKDYLGRLVAFIGLFLLSLLSITIGDIYLIYFSIVMAFVPLFLYFSKTKKSGPCFVTFTLLTGIAIAIAHYLRSHSGTALLIFMGIVIVLYLKFSWREKIILAVALFAGLLVPVIYFGDVLKERNTYLVSHRPSYEVARQKHPLWHSVYIGFGFLNNPYGIQYQDEVAIEKVRSISPGVGYLSQEYEEILKTEVMSLIKNHPLFVVSTLFAKIGVISMYLLIFSNIGLLAAVFYPKHWSMELAFWSGMGFSSLFGILSVPSIEYLLGFISLATLYGIVSINQAIESGLWREIAHLSRRIGRTG